MRTSKPIATISYNSKDYLVSTLQKLYKAHLISDFMYIYHHHEFDEGKDHFHVWMNPNKALDTMALGDEFIELVPDKPDKPLKCINFTCSKIDDWILYSMHFKPYLDTKCLEKEYHYEWTDFGYADEDTFKENLHHALNESDFALSRKRVKAIQTMNPVDVINSGVLPLNNCKDLIFYDKLAQQFHRQGLPYEFTFETEHSTPEPRITAREADTLKPFKQLKIGVDNPFDM